MESLNGLAHKCLECLPIPQRFYHDFPTSYVKQAALDNWDNIYFGLPCLSQEPMVLSQPQFTYIYY